MPHHRPARLLLALAVLPLAAACVAITELPRALVDAPAGVAVRSLDCAAAASAARREAADPHPGATLDPAAIRVLTWNLHKQGDAGWDRDLAHFAAEHDVVLLQEVTLEDSLRRILRTADMTWTMASSFIYQDADIGVLTATRVTPVAACTQREFEPLLQLPKSAIITWLRLPGTAETLAVANIHAINFTLSLGAYRAQLAALGDALAGHAGPVVLGGDMNTWTDDRLAAVRELGAHLGLTELVFDDDQRSLFFGKQLDHLFVRGLVVVSARAIPVQSSDHNPVAAVLRYRPH